jgi:hypothetical protein
MPNDGWFYGTVKDDTKPESVWRIKGPGNLLIGLRLATVSRWTFSVQPACTPRAGPCARLVPSWASRRPQLATIYVAPGPRCIAPVLSHIPPPPNSSSSLVIKA